ncbi:hypothetical protein ACGFSB_33670 [Streptomyces sp. NPDC048441]|uniref:hypothetical protein n=1 Tax=Streptomyces sp. NPDC048441 TaxID=3365552 RepID=UPI00370FADE9
MSRELQGESGDRSAKIDRAELDRKARKLLAAVRDAGPHLTDKPVIVREKVSNVLLAIQDVTAEMAGTSPVSKELPRPVTADETLLQDAGEFAVSLRSKTWKDEALKDAVGAVEPMTGMEKAPPGERAVAVGFEIASVAALYYADAEGILRKGVTEATRDSGDNARAGVKALQYTLGPSALTLADDVTKLMGDSVRKGNDDNLKRCVARLRPAIEAESPRSFEEPEREMTGSVPAADDTVSAERELPDGLPEHP